VLHKDRGMIFPGAASAALRTPRLRSLSSTSPIAGTAVAAPGPRAIDLSPHARTALDQTSVADGRENR
jgi:hypothetical protein